MLLQAQKEFNLNLAECFFVGDQKTDIEAGVAAGIGCNILFDPSKKSREIQNTDYLGVSSLLEVISLI